MRVIPSLGTIAFAALLAGCNLNTDYFSDYRGVNILADYDFDAQNADLTYKWTTTTVGRIAAAPTTDYYMTWGQATDLNGLSLDVGPSGSPAYRLEIKNLVPDGDFEAETEGSSTLPSGWATFTGSTPVYLFSSVHASNLRPTPVTFSALTIDNLSLLFSGQTNNTDRVGLSLDTALGTLWLNGSYRVRLDFINVGTGQSVGFQLVDDVGTALPDTAATQQAGKWNQSNLFTVTTPTKASISKTFTVTDDTTETRRLTIGSSGNTPDAVLIDNVRVIPADFDLSAKMTFSSLKSGTLPLLPGTESGDYKFTIQVHDDPTADQTSATITHVGNRFYPSGITVTIRGRAKNAPNTILAQQFVARPSGGWTSWTPLTFQGGLDFVDSDADLGSDPALEILLSPTNVVDVTTGGVDVGSLLVSNPVLTFNP